MILKSKQEELNVNRIFGFQLLVVFLHLEVKSSQILGQQKHFLCLHLKLRLPNKRLIYIAETLVLIIFDKLN